MSASQPKPETETPKCADCDSADDVVGIVYGDPRPDSDVTERARLGLVKLGGCCPPPDGQT